MISYRISFVWRAALCAFLAAFAVSASALEVIVDNHQDGCTSAGAWTISRSSCYGPDKYVHAPGTGADTMTWTAVLPAGWYRLDFRINSNTTCATDAHYMVKHRDGTDSRTISQLRGSSSWYPIGGAYYFNTTATVTLDDNFISGSSVVADAIRFQSIFSFVQMSDSHVGYSMGTSDATLVAKELKTLGKVTMAGYGFDAPPPSFAIHSGDFTEYGAEAWSQFQSIFSVLPFPLYYTLGNHDSTWNSCREKLRAVFGKPYYSFDRYDQGSRYHFAVINSSIIQSPRAAFSREELDWLAADLAALPPNTPVFLNFHHPIDGVSDPKPFDTDRLFETIRPYNPVIIFYGHGHSFNTSTFEGQRIVQGGSTYDAAAGKRGYNIVTIAHNRVHIARKIYGEPTAATGLLNSMTIPAAPAYPVITAASPAKNAILTSPLVTVTVSIASSTAVSAAEFELDGDGTWRAMTGSGTGPYTGQVNLSGSVHGRHWVRARFTMASGGPWHKMIPFWMWDALPRARWIADLGGSCLGAPALDGGRVYAGANGGSMRCLDAASGAEAWRVNLPGDVVSSPAVAGGRVVFGCSDGKVYCLDAANGATSWTKTCSGPVYSPPTIDGSTVYIGSNGTGASNSAYLYSLNLLTGAENWKYYAGYSIETKPFVAGGAVFFGAWDSYFYALNTSNGSLKWRYQRNSNRYYSPADSWPAASLSANRVFVADREYYMNAINIGTGIAAWTRASVSSQALTPDGSALLQRATGGTLDRTTFDNGVVWSASCSLDSAPVAPLCVNGRAAIPDQDGLVSVVNAATGAIQYQFQVARGYQLNPVSIDADGNIYAGTYEGFLVSAANTASQVESWNGY
ncbi:MAG: PQQ-binding-like beta-propeller repeat protein [bacterium]